MSSSSTTSTEETAGGISVPDLLITVAYFSIPLQLVVAVVRYPHLGRKAATVRPALILVILFALFIFLCGTGHLLRCLHLGDTTLFAVFNIITAAVSLITAAYLMPFTQLLLDSVDRILATRAQSKAIVEDLYPEPTMRRRMLDRMAAESTSGGAPVPASAAAAAHVGAGANSNVNVNSNDNSRASALSRESVKISPEDADGPSSSSSSSSSLSSHEEESDATPKMQQHMAENAGNRSASNLRAFQAFFQQPFMRRPSGGPFARRRSTDSGGPYHMHGNHASGGAGHKPDFDVRANDNAEPIAMQFDSCSVLLADIQGFTAWSARSTPDQVFTLLEHIFWEFDQTAREMGVFKLATVGDCYIATCGVPFPREDHAVALTVYAERCRRRMNDAKHRLAHDHGLEGVLDLTMRFGIHSGPITAGVLRGQKSRFELFGDTINTASRMESTGLPNRIQLSSSTAALLRKAGKDDWIVPRGQRIQAKGKGEMQTFLLKPNCLSDDDDAVTGSLLSVCRSTNPGDEDDGHRRSIRSLQGFDIEGQLNDLVEAEVPLQLHCKESLDLEMFQASLRSVESVDSQTKKMVGMNTCADIKTLGTKADVHVDLEDGIV